MRTVVILGTGGTIAGMHDDPARVWHYRAAQLPVAQLVDAVPALRGLPLEAEQVAQVDSKDMRWSVWRALGQAIERHLARDEVAGVVVTHGTDTLEETACLLHGLADGRKPIVLTAAMYPADAPDADGPANLRDAVRVAGSAPALPVPGGVWAVMAGRVWPGDLVRKTHVSSLDAFDAGGHAPLALIDGQGRLSQAAEAARWPVPQARGFGLLARRPPRVEILTSHADADGWLVDAALRHGARGDPLRGIVVAGTGHGTLHEDLEAALRRAEAAGVVVWRTTRVPRGGVRQREGEAWWASGDRTPAQARVALMLHLLDGA